MPSSLEFVTKENVKLVFPPADDFFNFCGPFVHRIIASSAPPNDYFCPLRNALATVANVNTIAFLSINFRQKITSAKCTAQTAKFESRKPIALLALFSKVELVSKP